MKKILVVSAIAALGLTSVALAGGLPEEMPAAPAAVGPDTGVYLGVSGGYGLTNWKNLDSSGNNEYKADKDNGFVGRAFLGYDINRYFAAEFGYSYFFNKAKMIGQADSVEYYNVKTQAFDLFGKGKLPVVDNFDLYAKLGVGYLMSNVKASVANADTLTGLTGFANNRNVFNVAFGAGADYCITPNVIANVEWLRLNGSPKARGSDNLKKYQPYTDAFVVGLRYKFDM